MLNSSCIHSCLLSGVSCALVGTLCRVALAFLALWHGDVVYREHMAGLLIRFKRISIATQLLESATAWCAGSQWTFPVQLFLSVPPWGLNHLLGDQTVPPSQSASPDMVEGHSEVSDDGRVATSGCWSHCSTVCLAVQEAIFCVSSLRRGGQWVCAASCPLSFF